MKEGHQYFVPMQDVGVLEAHEEVLSTMTLDGKRKWIYPTPSKGRFYYRRLVTAWVLIALFALLPVVHIGGKPAIFLDVLHREFTFFGVTFFPTDTFLLLLLLVGILLGIILFTALLGRVWCGWACPQTVYMEFLFRPIESWIEGPEHKRRRRDEGPGTWDKYWRKATKHGIFLALSLILAHTFVAYFAGWENLLRWMQASPTEHWGYFVLMTITTGLVLFDFGYFREQMCTLACPYARIQSVLVDPDSLIVSYDPNRGEPRAKRSKKKIEQEEAGLIPAQGDCIDCYACVRTCPVGIDIRDGLQMECIACTQCIDACDDIMDKIGKPQGLIRYTSENALAGNTTRRMRPRTVLYSVLLAIVAGIFTIALTTRGSYEVTVNRSVGAPYMELPDGQIANRLRFSVRNMTPRHTTFTIVAESPADAEVRVVGTTPIQVDAQGIERVEAWVVVPAARFQSGELDGTFRLGFENGSTETVDFSLLGPK
jgi:cytochrome c oxidase accessory protein FixG